MKKFITAGTIVLALVVPSVAQAHAPTPAHRGVYYYLRRHEIQKFGPRAPGRNILKDGLSDGRPVTDAVVVKANHVMERALRPAPKPVVVSSPVVTPTAAPVATAPTSAPSSYSGGYTIPSSIVQCESGGNYSAVNPSSGAGGAYQILPSTWAAYGGQGLPQNASPAEQGAIAAKIYASQGPGAWVC